MALKPGATSASSSSSSSSSSSASRLIAIVAILSITVVMSLGAAFVSIGGDGGVASSGSASHHLQSGGGGGVRPSNSPLATPSASPIPRPMMKEAVIPSSLHKADPKAKGCDFSHCPADNPFVYIITSYHNRAPGYNRFVRTMLHDVLADSNSFGPYCVCLAVADYYENPYGPTVEQALEDWPLAKLVVKVKGDFSRAGGFEHAMNAVTTPADKSIMYFMDADMIVYPGMLSMVAEFTRQGRYFFVPIVYSTWGNPDDFYHGAWRTSGSGMISFYMSDYNKAGGIMPFANRTTYGSEDARFLQHMEHHSGAQAVHRCMPTLWHVWHLKDSWGATPDGMKHGDNENPNDKNWKWSLPVADGVEELKKRALPHHYRCEKATAGYRYSGKDDMSKRPLFGKATHKG